MSAATFSGLFAPDGASIACCGDRFVTFVFSKVFPLILINSTRFFIFRHLYSVSKPIYVRIAGPQRQQAAPWRLAVRYGSGVEKTGDEKSDAVAVHVFLIFRVKRTVLVVFGGSVTHQEPSWSVFRKGIGVVPHGDYP